MELTWISLYISIKINTLIQSTLHILESVILFFFADFLECVINYIIVLKRWLVN